MKKTIGLILAMALLVSSTIAFSGCNNTNTASVQEATVNPTTETTTAPNSIKDETVNYAKYKEYKLDESAPVKNIILLIGDGMGVNHIKAAEIDKGDKLAMECMPHTAMVTTNSLSGVTDSAAAATALSCGVKTTNKSLCLDENGNKLENMADFAKSKGMKTGIAVTHIVNHATPAGFTAHNQYRDAYAAILKDQINSNINVMFGGGQSYYNGKLKNLLNKNNYQYISKADQLDSINPDKNVLGMFSYEEQVAGFKPYLSTLATKATELLTNDNGFFLMVEGSLIDVESHAGHMDLMLKEMATFDQAIDACLKYAETNPGTLVLVTADHETGGLKLPENAAKEDLKDTLFTSGGVHTGTNVKIYAAGAQSSSIFNTDVIDNTDIAKLMRKVITENSNTNTTTEKSAA